MKKRIALVRGPSLNSWDMQNFVPLKEFYDFVAVSSYLPDYRLSNREFPEMKLFSWGQLLRARILRKAIRWFVGDYHDLQGFARALKGFDIVHTVEPQYYFSYQAARVKEALGFKLVLTVWENIPFLYNNRPMKRNRQTVFREADLILAVSERTKEALILEGAPANRIRVQPPGIDTERFRPMNKNGELLKKFGCTEDDFIILMISRLIPPKGLYDLLFAYKRLVERSGRKRKMKLLVGGSGPEQKRFEEMARELGIRENVRLIGSFPYQLMPEIHGLGDVLVLPSQPTPVWQEQFGYVLLESMACGKPVISTMSGSIPEVVGDAGMLVAPNDFVSLSNALEEVMGNDMVRSELGRRGRARACDVFDLRKIVGDLKSHYESLVE